MKKIFIIIATALSFAACNNDKPTPIAPDPNAPVLTLTSESRLWFEADGGDGVITYTLENPAKGFKLEATPSVEWITDITFGDSITYLVAANDSEEDRRGTITVAYGEKSMTLLKDRGMPRAVGIRMLSREALVNSLKIP